MRKTLALIASAVALPLMCSTALAAEVNPFTDVPRDHWAYDAIEQLAADGVLEGYGDGTYRGDLAITRYEMAQMTARAMSKAVDGTDKALLDKLAAEFAAELKSLGVRVAELEDAGIRQGFPGRSALLLLSKNFIQKNRRQLERLRVFCMKK